MSTTESNHVPELAELYRSLVLPRMASLALRFWTRSQSTCGKAELFREAAPLLALCAAPYASLLALCALLGWDAWSWPMWAVLALCAALEGVVLLAMSAFCEMSPPPARLNTQKGCPCAARPGDHSSAFFPYFKRTPLLEYRPGLWLAQVPLTFEGVQFGSRMAVMGVGGSGSDRQLLVYSPVELTRELEQSVRQLGKVAFLVAPNSLHHLFVPQWMQAFPEAVAVAAPVLQQRRPDIDFHMTLASADQAPWDRSVVDVAVVRGHPLHQEIVVLHKQSDTLVLCDLIENFGHDPETPLWMRLLMRAALMYRRPSPPTDLKASVVDKELYSEGVRSIAAWRFDAIVLAHGRLVEEHAVQVWRDAMAYFL